MTSPQGARQFTGRWRGTIQAGRETEHDAFVERLSTPDGADLLRRCGLTSYALYRDGDDLSVVFRSAEPSIIAGFLKNKKLWPDFWEFTNPGQEGDVAGATPSFSWTAN